MSEQVHAPLATDGEGFVASDDPQDDVQEPYEGEHGPAAPGEAPSVYDALKDALASPNEVKEFAVRVPGREDPSISLIFDPTFDYEQLEAWMKQARDKRRRKNTDETRPRILSDIIISHQTVGILVKGKEAFTETGERLPLTSRTLQGMLGVNDVRDAIRKMFASDGHVISAAGMILEEAGYGDIDMESDDNPFND